MLRRIIEIKLQINDFNHENIWNFEGSLSVEQIQKVKSLGNKGLDIWSKFPYFLDVDIVRFFLRRIQGDQMIFEKPYGITKEASVAITRLCNDGPISIKKLVKNKEVEALIGVTGDHRALQIHTIVDPMISYVAYYISYKIYFRNSEGSTLVIAIYIVHQMVETMRISTCVSYWGIN